MRMIWKALIVIVSLAAAPASAEETVDCANAMSTVDLNICAGQDFEKADADLNQVYQHALDAIPEMATDDPQFNAKAWEGALRKSQRAWIAYRDAECDGHVLMFWTGGSGATADIIGCKQSLTEARTKELKARYEEGEAAPADEPNNAPPR